MGAYYATVASPGSRGAAFLAVCRGKVSGSHALPAFPHPRELTTGAWGCAVVEQAGPFPWAHVQQSLEGSPLTLPGAGRGGKEEVPRTDKWLWGSGSVDPSQGLAQGWRSVPDCEGRGRAWGRSAGSCGACG